MRECAQGALWLLVVRCLRWFSAIRRFSSCRASPVPARCRIRWPAEQSAHGGIQMPAPAAKARSGPCCFRTTPEAPLQAGRGPQTPGSRPTESAMNHGAPIRAEETAATRQAELAAQHRRPQARGGPGLGFQLPFAPPRPWPPQVCRILGSPLLRCGPGPLQLGRRRSASFAPTRPLPLPPWPCSVSLPVAVPGPGLPPACCPCWGAHGLRPPWPAVLVSRSPATATAPC